MTKVTCIFHNGEYDVKLWHHVLGNGDDVIRTTVGQKELNMLLWQEIEKRNTLIRQLLR